ncbi:MAG: type VI secretion protein, partial [Alteraurantiacibacter sp.]
QIAPAATRDIRVAAATPVAANDAGHATSSRETRIVTGSAATHAAAGSDAKPSRTRGIGSRFKSAPIRSTEKVR